MNGHSHGSGKTGLNVFSTVTSCVQISHIWQHAPGTRTRFGWSDCVQNSKQMHQTESFCEDLLIWGVKDRWKYTGKAVQILSGRRSGWMVQRTTFAGFTQWTAVCTPSPTSSQCCFHLFIYLFDRRVRICICAFPRGPGESAWRLLLLLLLPLVALNGQIPKHQAPRWLHGERSVATQQKRSQRRRLCSCRFIKQQCETEQLLKTSAFTHAQSTASFSRARSSREDAAWSTKHTQLALKVH